MDKNDWTPERTLVQGQMLCLESDIKKQIGGDFPMIKTVCVSGSMLLDMMRTLKAALATLDRLGYTYHGGSEFKPPLGPTSAAQLAIQGPGWHPIATAPEGVRVLLATESTRATPIVGIVNHFKDPDSPHVEQICTGVHYNGTKVASHFRASEWHALPPSYTAGEVPTPLTKENVEKLLRIVRDTTKHLWHNVEQKREVKAAEEAAEFYHAEAIRILNELTTK